MLPGRHLRGFDPARAADYQQRNVEYIRGLCMWLCALGFVFHTAAFIVWVVWYALTGWNQAGGQRNAYTTFVHQQTQI